MDLNNKLMIHFINTRLGLEMDPHLETYLLHHDSKIIEATDKEPESQEADEP